MALIHHCNCQPNFLLLQSGADKHQAGGVDEVSQVENKVDPGEHGHRHALVPSAQANRGAAIVGSLFLAAIMGVKVEDRPDDGR